MNKRAFTLLEVLVVIGIIAVIAAMLFPVLNIAKRSAKASTALQGLREIGVAMQLYAKDSDDTLPYSEGNDCYFLAVTRDSPCGDYSPGLIRNTPPINAALAPYGAEQLLFESPVDMMSSILFAAGGYQPTWWRETATPKYPGSSFEYDSKIGLAPTTLTSFRSPSRTAVMYSLYLMGPDSINSFQHVLYGDWHANAIPHSAVSSLLEAQGSFGL